MFKKESKAWAALARKLERDGLTANNVGNALGLCHEVDMLFWDYSIDMALLRRMSNRVSEHLELMPRVPDHDVPGTSYIPVWFDSKGVVETRVIAAQLLALEAKEDEDAANV